MNWIRWVRCISYRCFTLILPSLAQGRASCIRLAIITLHSPDTSEYQSHSLVHITVLFGSAHVARVIFTGTFCLYEHPQPYIVVLPFVLVRHKALDLSGKIWLPISSCSLHGFKVWQLNRRLINDLWLLLFGWCELNNCIAYLELEKYFLAAGITLVGKELSVMVN